MEYLLNTFNELNGIVWGAPMLVMILGTGLFLMFLLRFMPLPQDWSRVCAVVARTHQR